MQTYVQNSDVVLCVVVEDVIRAAERVTYSVRSPSVLSHACTFTSASRECGPTDVYTISLTELGFSRGGKGLYSSIDGMTNQENVHQRHRHSRSRHLSITFAFGSPDLVHNGRGGTAYASAASPYPVLRCRRKKKP